MPAAFNLPGAMGTGCVTLWEVMGPRETQQFTVAHSVTSQN